MTLGEIVVRVASALDELRVPCMVTGAVASSAAPFDVDYNRRERMRRTHGSGVRN